VRVGWRWRVRGGAEINDELGRGLDGYELGIEIGVWVWIGVGVSVRVCVRVWMSVRI